MIDQHKVIIKWKEKWNMLFFFFLKWIIVKQITLYI